MQTKLLPLLRELVRRCRAGEQVALCTLIQARGSTPQQTGAKMLVREDGSTLGTLGGGCVEAEVQVEAVAIFAQPVDRVLEFQLNQDYRWDDGLICGGSVRVLIQIHGPASDLSRWDALIENIERGKSGEFRLDYLDEKESREYVEPIASPPSLWIAGGGHIGQALARLADELGFRVILVEDRVEFAEPSRFPPDTTLFIGDFAQALEKHPVDPSTAIAIVTRGHKRDGRALAAVIDSSAGYIGMIGSKRKAIEVFKALLRDGVPREVLQRVHSPMGLEIGAVSPEEIALSILAEILAVQRSVGTAMGDSKRLSDAQWASLKDDSD